MCYLFQSVSHRPAINKTVEHPPLLPQLMGRQSTILKVDIFVVSISSFVCVPSRCRLAVSEYVTLHALFRWLWKNFFACGLLPDHLSSVKCWQTFCRQNNGQFSHKKLMYVKHTSHTQQKIRNTFYPKFELDELVAPHNVLFKFNSFMKKQNKI